MPRQVILSTPFLPCDFEDYHSTLLMKIVPLIAPAKDCCYPSLNHPPHELNCESAMRPWVVKWLLCICGRGGAYGRVWTSQPSVFRSLLTENLSKSHMPCPMCICCHQLAHAEYPSSQCRLQLFPGHSEREATTGVTPHSISRLNSQPKPLSNLLNWRSWCVG